MYQTMTLTFDHLRKLNKYNYLFCELFALAQSGLPTRPFW